jgi:hypothetical protein
MEPTAETHRSWRRRESLSSLPFVALFLGAVGASSIPANNAPDRDWVAAYATHGQQARHVITGLCLISAALCLMTFLAMLWKTVAAARQPEQLSRVPLIAARVSAASIAVGGLFMGPTRAASSAASSIGCSSPQTLPQFGSSKRRRPVRLRLEGQLWMR